MTVRVRREDWQRLHQLAISERTTLQGLMVKGLNNVLESQGLAPIEG